MSGEIIAMNANQNMMFEVENLEQASPATVSRYKLLKIEFIRFYQIFVTGLVDEFLALIWYF